MSRVLELSDEEYARLEKAAQQQGAPSPSSCAHGLKA